MTLTFRNMGPAFTVPALTENSMTLDLPDPQDQGDVWGEQLNNAINDVVAQAIAAAVAVGGITVGAVTKTATDQKGVAFPIARMLGSAEVWLRAAQGAIGGLATLDSGGQLPLNQAGNINPASIGASPVGHQHSLADLPAVARALDAAPAIAIFNTSTSTWPARLTLTTSPTRTVIWFGDADIPTDAIPGIDMFFGPDNRGGGTIPDPGSDPGNGTTDPDPGTGNTTGAPVVTVNGSLYNITATYTNGTTPTTYTYIQLAVRGPNGENLDTGFVGNVNLAAGATQALTGSGTASAAGVWKTWIAYNITGGTDQSNWVDGPATSFTIATTGGGTTPPAGGGTPGSRTIPLIGRSGLAWNSGVFFNAGDITSANSFASFRGRKLDSIMYFPGRASDSEMNYLNSGLTSWPGYRIVSLPTQSGGQNDSAGSGAAYTTFWTNYGKQLHSTGWDDGRTIMRLNWELNGDWYPHAVPNNGAASFIAAVKNAVNSIRINAPKTLFNLTMNRANQGANPWASQIYDPLIAHFDIIGLDWYDDFPAQNNSTAFNGAVAADPGPTSIATYCRAKGKMMWLDEWGISYRPDGPHGGDDPFFITSVYDWCVANSDVLAGETYYEDDGTNGQNGRLMPGSKTNSPNSRAAYISTSRWGGTGA